MLERKLFFGIEDIRGICLECIGCGTRVRLAPEKFGLLPDKCPGCSKEWSPLVADSRPAPVFQYTKFAQALRGLRETIMREGGVLPFKVLLEFDEPSHS